MAQVGPENAAVYSSVVSGAAVCPDGVALQLPDLPCERAVIRVLSAATTIYLGTSADALNAGIPLDDRQPSVELPVSNLNLLWIAGDADAEIRYLAFK